MTAYHTASQRARERYDSTNPGVIFEDDHHVNTEAEWRIAELRVVRKDHVIYVRATAWKRAFSENTESDGTIYCTLLPPSRVLEWMYFENDLYVNHENDLHVNHENDLYVNHENDLYVNHENDLHVYHENDLYVNHENDLFVNHENDLFVNFEYDQYAYINYGNDLYEN